MCFQENKIFSAAYAASQYIRNQGKTKCHLLLDVDAQQEYFDLELDHNKPDYVVVGASKAAIEALNGKELQGRNIVVNEAKPKERE